jgi:hypothetical protein
MRAWKATGVLTVRGVRGFSTFSIAFIVANGQQAAASAQGETGTIGAFLLFGSVAQREGKSSSLWESE